MVVDPSSDVYFPSLAKLKYQSLLSNPMVVSLDEKAPTCPISLTNPSTEGLYSAVVLLVTEAFKDQKDKGGYPYLGHLLYVSMIAGKWAGVLLSAVTEKQVEFVKVIGLLHDLYEDQPQYKQQLKDLLSQHLIELDVATIEHSLDCLTKRQGEQYSAYLERVQSDRFATVVKIADCQHNSIIERLPAEIRTDVAIQRCLKYNNRAERLKRFLMQQKM